MTEQRQQSVGTEKEVDMAVTAILGKVQGVKGALSSFVGKMEHEQLTWPSMLDSFATVSGHMSTLMKQLSSDKLPPLSSHVLLPLQVSSEKDSELEKSTEGRIPTLHHEVVPNYLRTKLDLDLEARQKELQEEAGQQEAGLKGDIPRFNAMLSSALERVNSAREELEEQRGRSNTAPLTTSAETKKLVAAYLNGQGLPPISTRRRGILRPAHPSTGKAPSAMKADLRAAAATGTAPYTYSTSSSSPLKNR